MFKFRPHRGMLKEAMKEVVTLQSKQELLNHLTESWGIYEHLYTINSDTVEIKQYGYDDRIDWDTYIVTIESNGEKFVAGFTDGPVL